MIKTESTRRILETDYKLPDDVQKRLDEYNAVTPFNLELHFDPVTNKWQFYNCKSKKPNPLDDVLHWQMSVPSEGLTITPGIIDWLKKYDTTQGGYKTQDDLRDGFRKWFKQHRKDEEEQRKKDHEKIYDGWQFLIDDLSVNRHSVTVPIAVGYNPKTGRTVRAYPPTNRRFTNA